MNTRRRSGSSVNTTSRSRSLSEKTWERDTSGLMAYAKSRKEAKLKQVDEAIATLLREHRVVNFNTVAKAAGVSKVYLYNQPLLRERIDGLREQE